MTSNKTLAMRVWRWGNYSWHRIRHQLWEYGGGVITHDIE